MTMIPNLYTSPDLSSNPFLFGYVLVSTTTTTAVFGAGNARANTTGFNLYYPVINPNEPSTITINTANVGVNGCWPNAITSTNVTPPSGFNFANIFAVGDSSGQNPTGLILYTGNGNVVNPQILPPGYDSFRYVNQVLINSSSQIVPWAQTGVFTERCYWFQDAPQILNAGNATSQTSLNVLTTTAQTGYSVLPAFPFIKKLYLGYSFTPNSASDVLTLVPTGLTPGTRAGAIIKTNGTVQVEGVIEIVSGYNALLDPSVDYFVTSSSDAVSLWLAGYEMSMDPLAV